MTYNIPTTFICMTYATIIPTTVVGTDIPTKLLGTVYFDKSCGPKNPCHKKNKNSNKNPTKFFFDP